MSGPVVETTSSRLFGGLDAKASRLLSAINSLSGVQRSVFNMRYILRMRGNAISARLGISESELDQIDREVICALRGGH